MSNILTGFSKTFLIWDVESVQTVIDNLTQPPVSKPTPLSVFASQFTALPTPSGIVNIPVPTYPTGADDLTSGMVVTDAQETTYQLTVNRDAGKFYAFRPAEAQQFGAEYIVKSFLAPAIYAIDATLNSASYALLPSFATSSVKPATTTAFSSSVMTSLNAGMSAAGINGERFAVLNSGNFWALIDDLSKKGNSAGAAAILSGNPNNPFATATVEAQLLPTVGNLVGFCGNKGGIAVGTAIPDVQHATGEKFVYKSPWTGVNYLVENYYDETNRKHIIGASVVYNVASVNPSILRIVSS